MHKKVLRFFAIVACAMGASISGKTYIDSSEISASEKIEFPRVSHSNRPLSSESIRSRRTSSDESPLASLAFSVPIFQQLIQKTLSHNDAFSEFIEQFTKHNDNKNGAKDIDLPPIKIPSINQLLEEFPVPIVTSKLKEARHNLMTALNITADLSTGLQKVVYNALYSDNVPDSIRIIFETIFKVYYDVAKNIPWLALATKVFQEGMKLISEISKSIASITGQAGQTFSIPFLQLN